jgi:hypothetical protein
MYISKIRITKQIKRVILVVEFDYIEPKTDSTNYSAKSVIRGLI